MTIKILKQGRLPEEVTYKFGCNNCATEFTAQKKDCKAGSDQRDGPWLEVACPLCNKQVTSQQEYKDPTQSARPWDMPKPPNRGWQDYVLETNPHNR
jgi:hypothetical protein